MTLVRMEADLVISYVHVRVRFEFEGRVLGIVGASGTGKTTLLHTMAGLIRPRSGFLRVDGKTWDDADGDFHLKPWERQAVLVPQDSLLFPHLTVLENMEYGGDRHTDTLSRMLGMDDRLDAYPHTLSGGERQRAAIARALNSMPRILLLDEPYSSLNRELRERVSSELHAWTGQQEIPYVIVSHDRDLVHDVADMVIDFDALNGEKN